MSTRYCRHNLRYLRVKLAPRLTRSHPSPGPGPPHPPREKSPSFGGTITAQLQSTSPKPPHAKYHECRTKTKPNKQFVKGKFTKKVVMCSHNTQRPPIKRSQLVPNRNPFGNSRTESGVSLLHLACN